MNASIGERRDNCDLRALKIATTLREASGAEAAILFGSRARGDHRVDSDVDILLISERQPPEQALRQLREIASLTQRLNIPEASGVDVGCMTPGEFMQKRASNCVGCQEGWAISAGRELRHGELFLTMAFRIVSSLRMQATKATFFVLPASSSLW